MYLLVSALTERRRWLTLGFILIERCRSVDLGGWGGEEGPAPLLLSEALESGRNVLFEVTRGLTRLGLCVIVEFPISCKTPLDCLLPIAGEFVLLPAGDTFSTSEDPRIVLSEDHVLEDTDLGVGSRVGSAAPLNPALRSCSFFVCLSWADPDDRGGVSPLSLLVMFRSAGELRCESAFIMLSTPPKQAPLQVQANHAQRRSMDWRQCIFKI